MSNPYGPPGGMPGRPGQQPYGSGAVPYGDPGSARPVPAQPPHGAPPPGWGPFSGQLPLPGYAASPGQDPSPGHHGSGSWHHGGSGAPQGFPDPVFEGRRRKRSSWPWLLGGFGVVAAVVVLFLGFVTPGWFHRTVFDAGAVQQGVQRVLEGTYGVQGVESVNCPDGEPVEPSHTFDCRVVVDGRTRTVTVTVTGTEGVYEVGHLR